MGFLVKCGLRLQFSDVVTRKKVFFSILHFLVVSLFRFLLLVLQVVKQFVGWFKGTMKRRVILELWICKKLGIDCELYGTLKQGYVGSCKMQKQKETILKTKANNFVYTCQLFVFSGLVLMQSHLSCPPAVVRVLWQYIESRSIRFNTVIFFVAFLPSTHIFYPYFLPHLTALWCQP